MLGVPADAGVDQVEVLARPVDRAWRPSRSGDVRLEAELAPRLLGAAEALARVGPSRAPGASSIGVGLPVSSLISSASSRIDVSTPLARL